MEREALLRLAGERFEREGRLIRLPPEGKAVFVGDTHGDLEATEEVVRRYLRKPYRIIFLGDYVDRGNQSEENIHRLLDLKLDHPDDLFLLAGNHEGYMVKPHYPADFWDLLSEREKREFGLLFSKFPLAASSENGLLALHGGLPDLKTLEEFDRIEWGDSHWERILWGDFVDAPGEYHGDWGGRPQFGRDYFERVMDVYQKRILVRSHQPNALPSLFDGRCLTIFTSSAYSSFRTILIADMEKTIRSMEDLTIERI
jgi:protein phosphatase